MLMAKLKLSMCKDAGTMIRQIKDKELYNDIRIMDRIIEDLKDKGLDKFDQVKSNVNLSDLKRKGSEILKKTQQRRRI